MTKQQMSERLINLWTELNSDVSKESKIELLTTISSIVHRELDFTPELYNVSLDPCNMVINEFNTALELNHNHVDELPSNLMHFIQAVENSSLPE